MVKSRRRAASSIDIDGSPCDLEALVSAPLLGLAPGQRDVDVAEARPRRHDLVDREALTDRLDAAERRQQRRQALLRHAEHLDVEVLGGMSAQPVAHPAADDERTPTGVADGARDVAGGVEGVHERIIEPVPS